tara:strand:+ start:370 stop:663 length:294 start_codon:yes stop_codon:yes gene_type:complete
MSDELFYLKYTAEYEAYIPASSATEAREKIDAITDYGTKNMNSVRYNEGGWTVVEELGELIELDQDNPDERDDFNTHKTAYGRGHFGEADYGVWFDA